MNKKRLIALGKLFRHVGYDRASASALFAVSLSELAEGQKNKGHVVHSSITAFAIATPLLTALLAWFWPPALVSFAIILPLIGIGLYDRRQTRHSLRRNYPLFGRGRWVMEWIRPFIRQYLIESDTDGAPINRMFRSIVYQRAKGTLEAVPFGTQIDTYRAGYEWMGHSLEAIDTKTLNADIRVMVGGPECRQPYSASIFNISAMSFGALSRNAILALNAAAKDGNFFHNTGEGGISPYHLRPGGDLVWQIGTGYFGCRDESGTFSPTAFAEKAKLPSVKMIEIKLSQGAKPGHGGILPAEKNTPEIAVIRGVPVATQIDSPPVHSAFFGPLGLLEYVRRLREPSGGKPVGIKLSIGRESDFVAICKAITRSGILPDFITVDGGEGGTGAAPLEYVNSVGMPLREAIAFVDDCLTGFSLRQDIRIIASGKILTGFHLVKNLALGADLCNSARGMMLALGCVQSLTCNSNRCPTGVATQDPRLYRGLVIADKRLRVVRYHRRTVHATTEIIASAGLRHSSELDRTHIYRRVSHDAIRRYDQIFPYLKDGSLLTTEPPDGWRLHLDEADPKEWRPRRRLTEVDLQLWDSRGEPGRPNGVSDNVVRV
ncbi:FMN-binding glutamate synthase family protein [Methylocystis suflitae]|uniref:FMN-binding glutamate synthase family protein n=1 Tax=Methylocystis suflitae TaxID=2951405 RepID=UPI00210C9346|nr:FMN-binding glutamate synthase family protein [Methylocystis suflitae]MCQ4188766.1 FMN-binding glutamate synthase family protein [Methylocystis suflitae]